MRKTFNMTRLNSKYDEKTGNVLRKTWLYYEKSRKIVLLQEKSKYDTNSKKKVLYYYDKKVLTRWALLCIILC